MQQQDDYRRISGSEYEQYARPELARLLRSLNLDVEYESGLGDHLYRSNGADDPVLDLVGGFGASILGHNHPQLVSVARRSLENLVPFNVQASVRTAAGTLAASLSTCVGATTGSNYVVTLGSTGADAVEAAIKHSAVERSRRLDAILVDLERTLRKVRRTQNDDICSSVASPEGRDPTTLLQNAIASIKSVRNSVPVFISLSRSFHGKTTGAGSLTNSPNVPSDLTIRGGLVRHTIDNWETSQLETDWSDHIVEMPIVQFDEFGQLRVSTVKVSTIAAIFVEPIQGEAGVREVPANMLLALRNLADQHSAALVFDEIQCGMYRTGDFLASTASGVVADYYLLSKSLGGGLSKISAMLVDESRYVWDFGRHHTSTFSEDEHSAQVALAAIDLAKANRNRIKTMGSRLRRALAELVRQWPSVFVEVRGRGLMLGIELRIPEPQSVLLQEIFDDENLGYLVAGTLLHEYAIRVMPTLSAPTTLRIQPSAFMTEDDITKIICGFEGVAEILHNKSFALLLDHLTTPMTGEPRRTQNVPRPRTSTASASVSTPRRTRRVAFLANVDVPTTLRAIAPELGSWTDTQCKAALERMHGHLDPFVASRQTITTGAGEVEVCMIFVPFTASQAVTRLQLGHGDLLKESVLEAVDLAFALDVDVIGLGGYTSIVTDASRDVVEESILITSGNSLTAACAFNVLRDELSIATGLRTVGIVGGLGNIGVVMAELLAGHCDRLILFGRQGSAKRLQRLADRLGATVSVDISDDLGMLRQCTIVVSATNSAEPVIEAHHFDEGSRVLICDLAVPGDVDPRVAEVDGVDLISGGRVLLPHGQQPAFPGITLPPGVVYSCMAETILLGIGGTVDSPSYGSLTVEGVTAAAELAERHRFLPARVSDGAILQVLPWRIDAEPARVKVGDAS
jgi:acetylornithine/succinyldiaminopimelate/putrescine aminotransferase/predicted amino acid dehydrogenase